MGRKGKNAIDAFVLARLEREKLKASPEARPEVLMRRVCLDITGLPPSPTEVDEFVRDYGKRGDEAYAELVDRLLASPRYAEKWTRWWLDAARSGTAVRRGNPCSAGFFSAGRRW